MKRSARLLFTIKHARPQSGHRSVAGFALPRGSLPGFTPDSATFTTVQHFPGSLTGIGKLASHYFCYQPCDTGNAANTDPTVSDSQSYELSFVVCRLKCRHQAKCAEQGDGQEKHRYNNGSKQFHLSVPIVPRSFRHLSIQYFTCSIYSAT